MQNLQSKNSVKQRIFSQANIGIFEDPLYHQQMLCLKSDYIIQYCLQQKMKDAILVEQPYKTQIRYEKKQSTDLQANVYFENQKMRISISQSLNIYQKNTHTTAEQILNTKMLICSVKEDLSWSFRIMHQDQKNKKSNKIGMILEHQGNQPIKLYFQSIQELQQWEKLLKRSIAQRGFHQNFKAIKIIGKGAEGTVYLTKCLNDGIDYAVKGIPKLRLQKQKNAKEAIIQEMKLHRQIDHPNLIKMVGIWESDNTFYMQYQLQTGYTVSQIIKRNPKQIPIRITKMIMKSVLQGLAYLESQRILHRDIKPENIIVQQSKAVIIDFGLATQADIEPYLFTRCGSPGFVAPEIANLQFHEHIEPKCDVFSLGVIFHIFLTGMHLFPASTMQEAIRLNRDCQFDLQDSLYSRFDPSAMNLLRKMLEIDPFERISAKDALNHPFICSELIKN